MLCFWRADLQRLQGFFSRCHLLQYLTPQQRQSQYTLPSVSLYVQSEQYSLLTSGRCSGIDQAACSSSAFSSARVRCRQNPLIARSELSCRS